MDRKLTHDALAMVEYSDRNPVCVLGDSGEAVARMVAAAEAGGCRVAWSGSTGDMAGLVDAPSVPTLIELSRPLEEGSQEAVAWAQSEADQIGRRVLICAQPEHIDLLAARSWHDAIEWLIEANDGDRVAAAQQCSRPRLPRLNDIGRDDGQPILQQLTEDVGRIAAMLASLTDEEAAMLDAARGQGAERREDAGFDAAYVRAIIRARRLRDQFFRGGLFADPAWDMLLDLMAARLDGSRVAVSSLCIAAAVPATTALRWIKALTDRGLFVRCADPQDGRRVYISLSDDAARALAAYLKAAQRIAPNAI